MNGLRFLPLIVLALLAALLAPSALAASTYYASPSGGGTECTQAKPCKVEYAAETKAQNGDSVILEPGTYTLGESINVVATIDLGGRAGAAAPTIQTGSHNIVVSSITKSTATLHDFSMTGAGGLVLNYGNAERLYVGYTGTSSSACSVLGGGSLRDSVCWAHNPASFSNALDVAVHGEKGTTVLRNDTLVAANQGGDGIHAEAREAFGDLSVDAASVIARGAGIDVASSLGGGGLPAAIVSTANSDYATTEEEGAPLSTVTAPGTGGNLTTAPVFVDGASGNFAEPAGAPTIDRGLSDSQIGATDLLGNPRSLPACIGGTPVPDIGAYEFVPTVACSQPLPAPAPSSAIKLGRLVKNAKKGTATLLVTVPGPGQMVLAGKGLRKVARAPKGAATLKLPVVPVGSAKRKLAVLGGLKLAVTVRFAPTGGSAAKKTRSVKLVESLR